ncbi:unnamed protein product [Cochlearia groenlandica]
MLLKQLKQLALTATRRNADSVSLARFYGSPAVCESIATSKSNKRLSRDERRAVVVSFVNEYREANDGRFPALRTILKEVGGGQYYVRDILQELKHKPNAPFPIAAKVTASVPNDTSSQSLNHPPSYSSASNTKFFSPVVVDPVFQAHFPDTVEAGSDQKQATKDIYHPLPDESNLEGSNIFITATPYVRESVEFLKNSDSEEEEKLTRLGSQESKADNLEGAAVSAKFLPSETRREPEKCAGEVKTVEKSRTWSSIVSFAKGFASFWRKG